MRRFLLVLTPLLSSSALADPFGTRPSPAAYDASPVGVMPILQMLFAIGLVGAGIKFALPAIMKRFGGRISTDLNSSIRIEESAAFPGGKLYVIEARGRTLLLGATAQNVTCLADLSTPTFAEALAAADEPDTDPMAQLARLERLGS